MPHTDDMYALETWCEQKALEAHNIRWPQKCNGCRYHDICTVDAGDVSQPCAMTGIRDLANQVLEQIRSNRASQRPHARE